ncbi:MAG: hypothetical protein H8E60_09855 [Candidatus Marinimicrobia bacterium]|nr:hypothetical protein [Candidatus Neomarinimicrobiota bacterium]
MESIKNLFINIGTINRRWIFLIVGLSVLLPLLFPINIPIQPTSHSQQVYNALNSLEPNSNILLSFEYGPSTKPEIHPMAISVLRLLFEKGHKVYAMALWPDGLFMSQDAFKQVAKEEYNKKYGVDYVNLGFKPGNEAVVKGVASDIRKLYTVDSQGILVKDIEMMEGIQNINDFDFVFSFSAGYPGSKEWLQFATDPNNIPLSTGCTSIQVTEILPYVENEQILGVLAGMPGAAEFENLIGKAGSATGLMAAQSFAHIIIILFIILGNLTYYFTRKKGRKY